MTSDPRGSDEVEGDPAASRDARIAAAVLAMRSPLARIELAASQLLRDAPSPAQQGLASAISLAVGDLDARLDDSLRALAPGRPDPAQREDCRPVLGAVRERLAGVLRARRLRAELCLPDARVEGDPAAARQAALALLRAGAARVGAGACLELSLVDEGARWGVVLTWPAETETQTSDAAECSLAALRESIWRQGGELCLGPASAAVYFARTEAS